MHSPRTSESRPNTVYPFMVGGIGGAAVWLAFARFDIHREGWDDPAWFTVGMPLLVLLCCGLGWMVPVRAWRWGVAPMFAQGVLAFAGDPTASLLPLGLALFAILALPCIAAAALGGFLRRKLGCRQSA